MEGFTNTFTAADAAINADEEEFDPFGIGVDTNANDKSRNPTTNDSNTFSADFAAADTQSVFSVKSNASSALPPRIMVKFKIEEEVSSIAHFSNKNEGPLDVQIGGTVLVSSKSDRQYIASISILHRPGIF